jgi:phosphodiesterase/alkaline phosphatase D-like protein
MAATRFRRRRFLRDLGLSLGRVAVSGWVKFQSIPADLKPNRSPKQGYQFFGVVAIDRLSKDLTVDLRNLEGKVLYRQVLTAAFP